MKHQGFSLGTFIMADTGLSDCELIIVSLLDVTGNKCTKS